jgi:hypothetical protein
MASDRRRRVRGPSKTTRTAGPSSSPHPARGAGVNKRGICSRDERWPLMAVLTWIATRSLKFSEQLAFSNPARAGQVLFEARNRSGAIGQISYSDAFHLLLKEIESRAIRGSGTPVQWIVAPEDEQLPVGESFAQARSMTKFEACDFSAEEFLNANRGQGSPFHLQDFTFHGDGYFTHNGSGFGSPKPDGSRARWSWKGVDFSRQEVLGVWRDFPCVSAWNEAKRREWKPQHGISRDWLKDLPPGQHIPLSPAVDLLAFGPSLLPVGLSEPECLAGRLRAGIALIQAGKDG